VGACRAPPANHAPLRGFGTVPQLPFLLRATFSPRRFLQTPLPTCLLHTITPLPYHLPPFPATYTFTITTLLPACSACAQHCHCLPPPPGSGSACPPFPQFHLPPALTTSAPSPPRPARAAYHAPARCRAGMACCPAPPPPPHAPRSYLPACCLFCLRLLPPPTQHGHLHQPTAYLLLSRLFCRPSLACLLACWRLPARGFLPSSLLRPNLAGHSIHLVCSTLLLPLLPTTSPSTTCCPAFALAYHFLHTLLLPAAALLYGFFRVPLWDRTSSPRLRLSAASSRLFALCRHTLPLPALLCTTAFLHTTFRACGFAWTAPHLLPHWLRFYHGSVLPACLPTACLPPGTSLPLFASWTSCAATPVDACFCPLYA